MANLIQADYEQLGDIGSRFQAQSEASAQLRSQVGRALALLKNDGWIGLGADAFFREMDGDVLPAVYRLEEALREAASVTKQIADLLNSADEDAASPFRSESGSGSASPIGSGGTAGGGAGGSGGAGPGAGGNTPAGGIPVGTPPNGMVGINPGDNDFGIPRDWLSGVTDSLPGGGGNLDSNWLDNVKDSFGLADSGGGSGSGSGSGSGAGGGDDNSSIASRAGGGLPGDGSGSGSGGGSTGGGSGSGSTGGGSGSGFMGSGSGGGSTGGGSGGGPTGGGSGSGSTGGGSGSGAGSGFPSSGTSPYQTPGEAGFRAGMSDFAGAGASGAGASFAAGSGAGGAGQSGAGGSLLDRAGSTAGAGTDGASSLGSMGVPLGIAAVSPFLALLGKALKDNEDDE